MSSRNELDFFRWILFHFFPACETTLVPEALQTTAGPHAVPAAPLLPRSLVLFTFLRAKVARWWSGHHLAVTSCSPEQQAAHVEPENVEKAFGSECFT